MKIYAVDKYFERKETQPLRVESAAPAIPTERFLGHKEEEEEEDGKVQNNLFICIECKSHFKVLNVRK